MNMLDVIRHYDLLIEEGNAPARDPAELQAYMDLWDGVTFLNALALDGRQSVLEIGVGTGRLALRAAPDCRQFTGIDLSSNTIARARDKSRAEYIDYGTRRVRVYPDDPQAIAAMFIAAGLTVLPLIETEFACIVAAERR